jgi:hypothetical protein
MAGISRNPQAFSTKTFTELKGKGYRLFPVNPNAESIAGQKCYPSVAKLPEKPGRVLVFTPPTSAGSGSSRARRARGRWPSAKRTTSRRSPAAAF